MSVVVGHYLACPPWDFLIWLLCFPALLHSNFEPLFGSLQWITYEVSAKMSLKKIKLIGIQLNCASVVSLESF